MSGTRFLYDIMLVLGYGYSKDCPPKFAATLFSSFSEGLFNSFGRGYVECRATTVLSLELMCTARELIIPALKSQCKRQLGAGLFQRVIVDTGNWTSVYPVCIEIFNFSFCSRCANQLQLSYRLLVAALSRTNSSALKCWCLSVTLLCVLPVLAIKPCWGGKFVTLLHTSR